MSHRLCDIGQHRYGPYHMIRSISINDRVHENTLAGQKQHSHGVPSVKRHFASPYLHQLITCQIICSFFVGQFA